MDEMCSPQICLHHNMNAADKVGYTALHLSAQQGHRKVVERLIQCQIAINAVSETDRTALHLASYRGHLDIVELLITHGSNLNVADKKGWTALHLSAREGHRKVVERLLQCQIAINAVSETGRTALHLASYRGHLDIVELLITHGCNINATEKTGCTALHLAAERGHKSVIEELIKSGCNINATEKTGCTALHLAAERGHKSVIEELIKSGADVRIQVKDGRTALSMAIQIISSSQLQCSNGSKKIIHQLIKNQNINLPRVNLAVAVEYASVSVVDILLQKGADPNSQYVGEPAIYIAIRNNSKAKCKLLLKHKVNLNVVHNDFTPLEYALAHRAQSEIVTLLLQHATNTVDAVRLLQSIAIPERNEPLICHAVRSGVLHFVTKLATRDNLVLNDFTGLNACHFACEFPEISQWLSTHFPTIMEKSKDQSMEIWSRHYSKVINFQLDPSKMYPIQSCSCLYLYRKAVDFRTEETQAEETKEIDSLAMKMLGDVSNNISPSMFQFDPQIRGSVAEGTKVGMPDELDVVLQLEKLPYHNITYEQSELSETHRRMKICEKGSVLSKYCVNKYLSAEDFIAAFYSAFRSSADQLLPRCYKGIHGVFFLPKHYFNRHKKISCINAIYRGKFFKDLNIKIDLVPTFSALHDYRLDRRVPLSQNASYFVIPKDTGFVGRDTDLPISYNECELFMMLNLPEQIKKGYILAKASRDVSVCGQKKHLLLEEPIRTDDFLTSYRLKVCLMHLLSEFEDDNKISEDAQSATRWAKNIYTKLKEFLNEGKIPSFYSSKVNVKLFSCRHALDLPQNEWVKCCSERHFMLSLTEQIISFLDNAEKTGSEPI